MKLNLDELERVTRLREADYNDMENGVESRDYIALDFSTMHALLAAAREGERVRVALDEAARSTIDHGSTLLHPDLPFGKWSANSQHVAHAAVQAVVGHIRAALAGKGGGNG